MLSHYTYSTYSLHCKLWLAALLILRILEERKRSQQRKRKGKKDKFINSHELG